MNQRLTAPFEWDDAREYDRGKVMTADELEAGRDFGRYKDVDGDGIPYRTYPGTHPEKGAYFTRGTSRDPYARYSEKGPDYIYNMERLLRKFDTAKALVPQPLLRVSGENARYGVIYYGSTTPAMAEAIEALEQQNLMFDTLRVRAFPFPDIVADFILAHARVFVVEQNRDGQLRTLLINEFGIDPARLVAVLHYDGTPITARFIVGEIGRHVQADVVTPLNRDRVA
jgi:2-oxoglutarate ferredoxin oxidoreductase subunit alpha